MIQQKKNNKKETKFKFLKKRKKCEIYQKIPKTNNKQHPKCTKKNYKPTKTQFC